MTQTVEQNITRSLRMLGVLADGETPSAGEADDALTMFNFTQRALFGDVIGVKLEPETGATGTVRHGAMYQVGAAAYTLTLPANPKAGWRFGVADAKNTLNTFNTTIAPNGRKIEDSVSSLVLSTASVYRTWFFRDDTGDWVREKDLVLSDTIYFPDILLGGLAAMNAVNMAGEYGREASAVIVALAGQGRLMFQQTYGRRGSPRLGSPAAAAR